LEGVSASGLFEKAAAGGEYVTKCLTYSRNDLSCMVTDLLADRDYHIQARERCTDPFADSEYYRRYVECRTLTAPAEDPEGLTVADGDLYTMQVAWVPGDPKACIFLYMDVQVKENGTDWPEGDNPPVFGCRVANRSITKCAVHVGLGSGLAYEVRMRETCTVRRLFSQFVVLPRVPETRMPVTSQLPENLVANSPTPTSL
ncbi:unnamed protein product, partial [Polarella glacialis]